MVLAKVIGTVVSAHKEERLAGVRFLLLDKINPATMQGKGDLVVAIDGLDAGPGEIVFFVAGSSARLTAVTDGKPTDATIIAIVDNIEIGGKYVYQKDKA
ncbi:MAG: EutN/CcmL family microcompartment protein [Spirochaetota bacterium]|jgi:microcompartment protein CcmK/EutM|nr:EutN/CcmL family microcompartment protein [Spirochaetota bacterium]